MMSDSPSQTTIDELICRRYSCRSYQKEPLEPGLAQQMDAACTALKSGPFHAPLRFRFASAANGDGEALKGLGTYGTIRNPTAFIIGAAGPGPKNLEDYGYCLETLILQATGLGLGTCWLGGFFTKSSFARAIQVQTDEIVPAVVAAGLPAELSRSKNLFRILSQGNMRHPWERLFFHDNFETPLSPDAAGAYARALELVRLGPSASNKQPWRVLMDRSGFHFFIQRASGYGQGSLPYRLMRLVDLQRVDLGIALCHFELSARERSLRGRWEMQPPAICANSIPEYGISWIPEDAL
jgi:nitroreductase